MNSTLSGRHNPRHIRQAMNLWLSLHRLGNVLDGVSGQAPAEIASDFTEPSSHWPIPKMPQNQIAYQEWLLTAAASIFQCGSLPDSPIFILEAPTVRGLVIYGAQIGDIKFIAAWIEWSGTFVGWLKVQPAVEGVDSDFGVGEVLSRPIVSKVSMDMKRHLAVDRFRRELGKVAWAIGTNED